MMLIKPSTSQTLVLDIHRLLLSKDAEVLLKFSISKTNTYIKSDF